MNEGQPKTAAFSNEQEPERETIQEKRYSAYASALETFKEHDEAEHEAEQLLFREKIAVSGPEVAIAGLELKIASAQEQKENFAKSENPFSEEAWAVREMYLTTMKDMFCLYCDVRVKSPELARYMEEEMPWLKDTLTSAEEIITSETEEKVEHERVDGYDEDAGLQKAA